MKQLNFCPCTHLMHCFIAINRKLKNNGNNKNPNFKTYWAFVFAFLLFIIGVCEFFLRSNCVGGSLLFLYRKYFVLFEILFNSNAAFIVFLFRHSKTLRCVYLFCLNLLDSFLNKSRSTSLSNDLVR